MRHLALLLGGLAATAIAATATAQDSGPGAARPAEPAKTVDAIASPAAEAQLGMLVARRVAELGSRGANRDDVAAIAAYYTASPDRLLWTSASGWSPRGERAVAELEKADDWGLAARDYAIPGLSKGGLDRSAQADAEARLALALLKYARDARGGRMDPTQLAESIDRPAQVRDPKLVLAELAGSDAPDAVLRKQHPQHPQFEKLRKLFNEMRSGKAATPAPVVVAEPPPEEGATKGKGKAKQPRAKPAAPETGTAQRIALNMEQWRWMPEDLGNLYVTVNLPEYTLRVVKNGQVIHSERVIIGEVGKQTPIFSQDMQSVVFHPGWGVPNSIKVKELLPGLLAGRDTLTRSGLRASYRGRIVDPGSIDWQSVDIRNVDVVQPPGSANVLGVVKFQFPNKHDVYMHDTPTKHLFNSDQRTFSHGCMRVRNPVRLAEILFQEDQGWAPERVASLVKGGPMDNKVMLQRRIPVHITYFTTVVDDADKPQFFRDVYGHEQKVQLGLDGKAHLIPKKRENLGEARAEVMRRAGSSFFPFGGGNLFGNIFSGF